MLYRLPECERVCSGICTQVANVYICTGRYAKVYHSNKNCKGLDNCKGEVKLVSLETAKQQGKRACKLCYKK